MGSGTPEECIPYALAQRNGKSAFAHAYGVGDQKKCGKLNPRRISSGNDPQEDRSVSPNTTDAQILKGSPSALSASLTILT